MKQRIDEFQKTLSSVNDRQVFHQIFRNNAAIKVAEIGSGIGESEELLAKGRCLEFETLKRFPGEGMAKYKTWLQEKESRK
jgi:hypothetical protein